MLLLLVCLKGFITERHKNYRPDKTIGATVMLMKVSKLIKHRVD